jgi:hypothetical protein
MAAGQGFKTFATGDVLTAPDVNGYLMQGVLVFASAAARTSAITSPQQGQVSFLKDTNVTQYYNGSAWVTIGGGSSPLTTKGDIYGYSTTDARIPIGSNGQVLTADSTQTLGLKWAAAGGGALTLLSTTSLSGAETTVTISDTSYTNLYVQIPDFNMSSTGTYGFRINEDTTANGHVWSMPWCQSGGSGSVTAGYGTYCAMGYYNVNSGDSNNYAYVTIEDYTNSLRKMGYAGATYNGGGAPTVQGGIWGTGNQSAVTKFTWVAGSGSWSGGTIKIYGVK